MNEAAFEWDENKAARNIAAHGISFEVACEVFDDELAIERPDEREDYGEDRTNIAGMVKGRLLTHLHPARIQDPLNLCPDGRTL